MKPADYAVVIVGAGVAGCTLGRLLREHGAPSVLIVESDDEAEFCTGFKVGESIPPDTRRLLEQLGLWDEFRRADHALCLGSRSSWGEGSPAHNDFFCHPYGNGWHLDRNQFEGLLLAKARQSGVEVSMGTRFLAAHPTSAGRLELQLQGRRGRTSVCAGLIVDATGVNSRVARYCGARQLVHDRLICVCQRLDLPPDSAIPQLTLLEAVADGWWYAAPTPHNKLIVAFATDAEALAESAMHRRQQWCRGFARTQHLRDWLGETGDIAHGELAVRVAPSFLLDSSCAAHWLAIGDAAAAVDPITSQGIHKALLDSVHAAAAITDTLHGNPRALANFQSSVRLRFAHYLKVRNHCYQTEQRWSGSGFWRRRRERAAPPFHLAA